MVTSLSPSVGNPLIAHESFIPSPLGEMACGINNVSVTGIINADITNVVGTLSIGSFQTPLPFTSGFKPVLEVSLTVILLPEMTLTAGPIALLLIEMEVLEFGTTLITKEMLLEVPGHILLNNGFNKLLTVLPL